MRRIVAILATAATAACAPARGSPGTTAAAPPASRTAEAEALPDGAGKQILGAACTSCHDLGEVTKFRGYYNRAQWRDMVITMVEYGAKVNEKEVEVLSDYLVQHLGKK